MLNKRIANCRLCGSKDLSLIGNFGNQYLTNFPNKIDKTLPRCPLNLVLCNKCKLLQLEHTANFDYLYRDYWYVSGINQTMKDALRDVVARAIELTPLELSDVVIDIGSNDSTLLKYYPTWLRRIGFEPAQNLMELARYHHDLIILNNFFNYEDYKLISGDKKAKIITVCACFYDLDDPNEFVEDMVKCLLDDGIIIIQLNYLSIMLENNTFDNISHEHLEYYCLMTLENLLNRHNLEIFDLELNDVNGGSLRIYIKKQGSSIKGFSGAEYRLKNQREYEKKIGLNRVGIYKKFAKDTTKLRKDIHDFVIKEKKRGKTIYVYGASTRGNALLQACNLDYKTIDFAVERNPMKFGRYMVGSWILIISEEQARKEKPDYFLVLPWQFREEFIGREKEFLDNGGKFIFIFPKLEIYGKSLFPKDNRLPK